jgi:hypothetical protein
MSHDQVEKHGKNFKIIYLFMIIKLNARLYYGKVVVLD